LLASWRRRAGGALRADRRRGGRCSPMDAPRERPSRFGRISFPKPALRRFPHPGSGAIPIGLADDRFTVRVTTAKHRRPGETVSGLTGYGPDGVAGPEVGL
jgi:hypothetical protein